MSSQETISILNGLRQYMREQRVEVPDLADRISVYYPGFNRSTLYRWLNGDTRKVHAKYFDALTHVAGRYMPPVVRGEATPAEWSGGRNATTVHDVPVVDEIDASPAGDDGATSESSVRVISDAVVVATPELRAAIQDRMLEQGLDYLRLCELSGYDKPETVRRVLSGELPFYAQMLKQVVHALGLEPESLPLAAETTAMLAAMPRAHVQVRDAAVLDSALARHAYVKNQSLHLRNWQKAPKTPVPTDGRAYLGFRIEDAGMEPRLSVGDVVLVDEKAALRAGSIVVAWLPNDVFRIRLFQELDDRVVLMPLNPSFQPESYYKADLRWIARAVRKQGDL